MSAAVTDGSTPAKPTTSNTHTFNFAASTFGTIKTGWQHGAPTYASGNSNKYYYSMATITESSFGGSQSITFGDTTQAIGFSGSSYLYFSRCVRGRPIFDYASYYSPRCK